jgi:hypothetical protein
MTSDFLHVKKQIPLFLFNETWVSFCKFSFIFSFFPYVRLSFFLFSFLKNWLNVHFFCETIILLFHTHTLKQEQQKQKINKL